MTQKQDGQGRTSVVWIVNGALLLIIGLVIGLGPIRAGLGGFGANTTHSGAAGDAANGSAPLDGASTPTPATSLASIASTASEISSAALPAAVDPASASSTGAASTDIRASITMEPNGVSFLFASGSAELSQDAPQALADVVRGVAAGRRVSINGYRDATGNAAANAELARRRAQGVLDALHALGVGDDKIDLHPPRTATGSGDTEQARQVEVTLE